MEFNNFYNSETFNIINVPGDGNCLYYALAIGLNVNNIMLSADDLRTLQNIYIRENKDDEEFKSLLNKDHTGITEKYNWGFHSSIVYIYYKLKEYKNFNITIYYPNYISNKIISEEIEGNEKPEFNIKLYYNGKTHYNLLLNNEEINIKNINKLKKWINDNEKILYDKSYNPTEREKNDTEKNLIKIISEEKKKPQLIIRNNYNRSETYIIEKQKDEKSKEPIYIVEGEKEFMDIEEEIKLEYNDSFFNLLFWNKYMNNIQINEENNELYFGKKYIISEEEIELLKNSSELQKKIQIKLITYIKNKYINDLNLITFLEKNKSDEKMIPFINKIIYLYKQHYGLDNIKKNTKRFDYRNINNFLNPEKINKINKLYYNLLNLINIYDIYDNYDKIIKIDYNKYNRNDFFSFIISNLLGIKYKYNNRENKWNNYILNPKYKIYIIDFPNIISALFDYFKNTYNNKNKKRKIQNRGGGKKRKRESDNLENNKFEDIIKNYVIECFINFLIFQLIINNNMVIIIEKPINKINWPIIFEKIDNNKIKKNLKSKLNKNLIIIKPYIKCNNKIVEKFRSSIDDFIFWIIILGFLSIYLCNEKHDCNKKSCPKIIKKFLNKIKFMTCDTQKVNIHKSYKSNKLTSEMTKKEHNERLENKTIFDDLFKRIDKCENNNTYDINIKYFDNNNKEVDLTTNYFDILYNLLKYDNKYVKMNSPINMYRDYFLNEKNMDNLKENINNAINEDDNKNSKIKYRDYFNNIILREKLIDFNFDIDILLYRYTKDIKITFLLLIKYIQDFKYNIIASKNLGINSKIIKYKNAYSKDDIIKILLLNIY